MVPAEYQGLWRRSGIWRSNGTSDLTTQVWWFQSAHYHIDLRLPVDRIGITGFAGVTVVDGERCEWQPEIAFPAISGDLDAGWMRFDDADHVHETGLDNSYEEDWYRESGGAMHGLRLTEVHGAAIAYLLISEDSMAWACGQPDDKLGRSEFSVFQHDQAWQQIASNLSLPPKPPISLSLDEVLQWTSGDIRSLDLAPARQWRIA